MTFTEANQRSLGFKIIINCENCERTVINSCPLIDHAYEINRRIIFAMRLLGIGLHELIKFCAVLDLPQPVFHSFYDSLVKSLSIATAAVRETSIKNAAIEEKRITVENGQTNGITVSGDGSWRKRGFSSLFGLVTLIGWCTSKVVDVQIKSKYRKMCEYWSKKEDTAEYNEWMESHADNCQSNHQGSAGKMEANAVVEMFQRSEAPHNVKYENYIGNGDSKTFKGILEAEPYENLSIKKNA